MIKHRYYVFHKVQTGKNANIIEAGRIVSHNKKLTTQADLMSVCGALAKSHGALVTHVMIVNWQYMGWDFDILNTVGNWCRAALHVVNREPGRVK